MKTQGFIDRSPLWFFAGILILTAAVITKSFPLTVLAIFDLGISFVFFFNPDIADRKSAKFFISVTYGAILLWCFVWLMSKLS